MKEIIEVRINMSSAIDKEIDKDFIEKAKKIAEEEFGYSVEVNNVSNAYICRVETNLNANTANYERIKISYEITFCFAKALGIIIVSDRLPEKIVEEKKQYNEMMKMK